MSKNTDATEGPPPHEKEYSADSIKVMTFHEHVRARTAMHFGPKPVVYDLALIVASDAAHDLADKATFLAVSVSQSGTIWSPTTDQESRIKIFAERREFLDSSSRFPSEVTSDAE